MNQQGQYLSYLLRLWQESGGNPPLWRASLERPQIEERQSFASLADLVAFLENETGSRSAGSRQLEEEKKGAWSHG